MRAKGCFVLLLLLGVPIRAELLQPSNFSYLGVMEMPTGTEETSFNYAGGGLTIVPDCMGLADPTSDDDYPGCLLVKGQMKKDMAWVRMVDLVPAGAEVSFVGPWFDLSQGLIFEMWGSAGTPVHFHDILYDKGADYCRIWWTATRNYANSTRIDSPFLGVSDCNPDDPNPRGMWDFGAVKDKTQNSNKFKRGLGTIPQGIADRYFDGNRMALMMPKTNGARGGGPGSSLAVRPLTEPTEAHPEPVMDLTPVLNYRLYPGAYGKAGWSVMDKGDLKGWFFTQNSLGQEIIQYGDREAMVVIWHEPIASPDEYPRNDPNAPYENDDPNTPSTTLPTCWYGVSQCRDGPAVWQQPSFWDSKLDGTPMPKDCKIFRTCPGVEHTGPWCNSPKIWLVFYDLAELAKQYRGEEEVWTAQPYAKEVQTWWPYDTAKGCKAQAVGSTYDPRTKTLYIAQFNNKGRIHMLRVGGNSERASPQR